MTPPAPAQPSDRSPSRGRLDENVLRFARTLRAAGMKLGSGQIMDGVKAATDVGIARREDLYWALHCVFVKARDQHELFDQAFTLFWRNPDVLNRAVGLMLPDVTVRDDMKQRDTDISQRLLDALSQGREATRRRAREEPLEIDAALTFSPGEKLQSIDFEKMTLAELNEARRALEKMHLGLKPITTRRFQRSGHKARIDMRRSFALMAKSGGDDPRLFYRKPRVRPPALVVLCDISGSMSRYSRMFLHFLHGLSNDRDRVHAFTFGTRLTNITRFLKTRDVDEALHQVSREVKDWSGGTRIGQALNDFNRIWSRRVLGQGAVVLIMSDGLDREGAAGLEAAMQRLHLSTRRLIWLNPLLRYDGYEASAQGARAMLPHVDELRRVHNLESLADLARALSETNSDKGNLAT